MTYLGVHLPGSVVDVGQIVADLVVVLIVPFTSYSTKHLSLSLSLDTLGTSSDTTSRDTTADKTIVVTAAIKGDESVVETLLLVPVNVKVAQLLGSLGVGSIGSVVDLVSKVGTGHHVVVHEEADLLVLFLGKNGDVVVGSEETFLLGGPPGEADTVVDPVLGQLDSDLKHRDTAGAIIIDTRTLCNAVTVATEHDTVLRVTTTGLGDDVGGLDGLDLGVDVGNSIDLLTILDLLGNSLALITTETKGSDVIRRRSSESTVYFTLLVVVYNSRNSTRLASVGGLCSEGASSAEDEGDVSLNILGIIGLVASLVVHKNKLSMDRLFILRRRSQGQRRSFLGNIIAENKSRLENVTRNGRELLVRNGVVSAQLGQFSVNVRQRAEMA